MPTSINNGFQLRPVDEAISYLELPSDSTSLSAKPITVIGTETIRQGFEPTCFQQAINSRLAPGVTDLVLNPDAHTGYGAPVGCVLVSPTHIYPGPVGVDIKCSMSLLQMDIPEEEIKDRKVRRAIINAICERIPTGPGKGQRSAKKSRSVNLELGTRVVTEGATESICLELGIPPAWIFRCEDARHTGHNGTAEDLRQRLELLAKQESLPKLGEQLQQLGSYGGGNHFGECNAVHICPDSQALATASSFGLLDNCVAFLSHCGSRGFGHRLATLQFRALQEKFERDGTPFPGGDKELVYAPLGTEEANSYLDDMALGANFATLNHLLINALVLEAFQEILPGTKGELVYFISHNIARREIVESQPCWVHRKGSTRALPKGHPELVGTPFSDTGHPILLPGNPEAGSAIMVAEDGAIKSCYSVNHGAGRRMGRRAAIRELNQETVDSDLDRQDILTNCRRYPLDEAPAAYKDFHEVLRSVELAGLARTVANLRARFVIKDGDESLRGAA